ncbi:serine/threonine protein kinase [Dimargaris xerosporica]|nr:serine/threonine protein kinase [Dimargaris xerosporica]
MAPSTLERQPSPPRLASRRKSMSVPHAPDSQQGPRPKDQQHHPHYSLDIAPGADKMHQLSTVTVDRIRREEEEQRIAASGKKSLGLLKPQPSPHRHNQHAQTQAPQPSPQAGRGGRHRSIHHFFFPIKRFLHKQHGPVPKPSVLKTSAPPSRSGSPPEPSSPRGGGGGDRLSTGSSEASAARRRYLSHEGSLKQYGKTVKVIGHGTGGTVRLLEEHSGKGSTNLVKKNSLLRSAGLAKASPAAAAGGGAPVDLTAVGGAAAAPGAKVYAVKEFRAREPRESEREYYKKITSEYCIGSSIHHDNIVETLDIVFEGSHIYEIMEYCPYDLFNVVASGKMGLDECACCWAQIVHGVRYLHSLGIAHRDLKLENCLLNDEGVLKIIDFGCAVVFKTPYEQVSHLVTGYTGSDPYIAPELHLQRPYDPKSSDLWSLGIILFAMTMAKFPWKAARRDVVDYATYSNNHNRRTAKPISTLPIEAARPLLASLLQPDVKKRATMDDILQDEWFKSIPYCKPGSPCKSHSHHLC